jgi:peptidoglycan hydrolase CwlO-like protein
MKKKLLICMMLAAVFITTFGTASVCAIEDTTLQPDTTIEDVVTETPADGEEIEMPEEELTDEETEGELVEEENYGKEFIQNELLPMLKNILISVITFGGLIALFWKQVKELFEAIKGFAAKCGLATDALDKAKEKLTEDVEKTKEAMVKEVAEAKEEMEKVKAEIQKSEGSITEFKANLESLQKKLDIFMKADKMAKLNDASLIASGVANQIEEVYNEINNG